MGWGGVGVGWGGAERREVEKTRRDPSRGRRGEMGIIIISE